MEAMPGYAGDRVAPATTIRVEIVRKPKQQVGFAVHARRWAIERFFAWLGRNRRLAKGFETTIASANAFLYAASVTILLRPIARCIGESRQRMRYLARRYRLPCCAACTGECVLGAGSTWLPGSAAISSFV